MTDNEIEDTILREKIIKESRVRDVFTPFHPVTDSDLLSGRKEEINDLVACINTPGQHALIYGERGIGKSSLSTVISKLSQNDLGYSIYLKKCDSLDTFTSIMSDVLADHGYDVNCGETVNEHTGGGSAKASVLAFGANVTSSNKKIERSNHETKYHSAAWAAKVLKDKRSLIIIDEVDIIDKSEDRLKIAEFIKHLSDYKSDFKVILVGISSTGRDLVSNHRSVERCINEIYLQPINVTELREIIIKGASKLSLEYKDEVIDDIVDISGGYPHLIALKCAEKAIVEKNSEIGEDILLYGLKAAARFSDGRLRRNYEEAVFSKTELSKKVLLAAALCHSKGFLLSEITEMMNQVVDTDIDKNKISACLSNWIKSVKVDVVKRVSRGHYCFTDPRFLSYVKMINGFTYDNKSIFADILREEYSKRYIT